MKRFGGLIHINSPPAEAAISTKKEPALKRETDDFERGSSVDTLAHTCNESVHDIRRSLVWLQVFLDVALVDRLDCRASKEARGKLFALC